MISSRRGEVKIPNRRIILGPRQLDLMKMFQSMTGVATKDVVIDEEFERLIFLVNKGDLGRAIGRRGRKLEILRKVIRRNLGYAVEVVEYDDDLKNFIRNLLSPARVNYIELMGEGEETIAYVKVPEEDLGIAIGKDGRRIRRARLLVKRWFQLGNVKIGSS